MTLNKAEKVDGRLTAKTYTPIRSHQGKIASLLGKLGLNTSIR
jgi:hypothetical protein